MSDEIKITPNDTRPVDSYNKRSTDIIPDEVPRKDGPGGESSENKEQD